MSALAVVHVAGPVIAARQDCSRCGYTLEDYSGRTVMVPEGDDRGLSFWPEGQQVMVSGNAAFVTSADAYPQCKPAS